MNVNASNHAENNWPHRHGNMKLTNYTPFSRLISILAIRNQPIRSSSRFPVSGCELEIQIGGDSTNSDLSERNKLCCAKRASMRRGGEEGQENCPLPTVSALFASPLIICSWEDAKYYIVRLLNNIPNKFQLKKTNISVNE